MNRGKSSKDGQATRVKKRKKGPAKDDGLFIFARYAAAQPPQYSPSLTQAPSKPSYCFWSRSLTVKDVPLDLNRDNKDENPSSSIVPLSPWVSQPRQSHEFQLGSRRSAFEIFKEIPPQTITLPFSPESWPGTVFSFSTTVTSDKLFLSNLPHLLYSVWSTESARYPATKMSTYTCRHSIHLPMLYFISSLSDWERLKLPGQIIKLHILSQVDIADYSSGEEVCTLLCHPKAFSDSRPRFRDLIKLLSVASKLSASECFRCNSHSFFAAAEILIVEDVCCMAFGLYTTFEPESKGDFKRSKKVGKKLGDFVKAVEISFYVDHFRELRLESERQDAMCPLIKAISGCLSRFAITVGLCE